MDTVRLRVLMGVGPAAAEVDEDVPLLMDDSGSSKCTCNRVSGEEDDPETEASS